MSTNTRKKAIFNSYEIEIKVSLVLLICFLLSLNFLSAYSLGKARQAQQDGHIVNMELVKNSIRMYMESNNLKKPNLAYLNDLANLASVDKIEIVDSLGNRVLMVSSESYNDRIKTFTTSVPVRNIVGDIAYRIYVTSTNHEGEGLKRLAIFDSIFRISGLFAGLIVAFLFIRSVMNPYRKIKKEAAKLDLPQVNFEDADDVEYAVRTFQEVIKELKEKESILQSMYASSEKRADSLARYNEYILGGISSGVIICDNDGFITRFNPAAEKILEIPQSEAEGEHFKNVFAEIYQIANIFDEALTFAKTFTRTEFELHDREGEKRWIGLSSSLISDNQNHGIGAAVLLTDLTKIKKLQEISDFTEKMAALGEMAAGLAHEFRNSVAAIMGFGKLIKKMIPEDDKAVKIADMIISESQATEEMLKRFLTFARPLDVQPQRVDLARIISDALHSARESCGSKNIEAIIENEAEGLEIDGDPTLLGNAFKNLFINAYQAMPDSGVLGIYLGFDSENGQAIIRISDTGKGIPDDVLPKIFNPFFTTKDKGTGLGLALVRKIITSHGGYIEAESEEGKGTTFILVLPVELENKPAVESNHTNVDIVS